MTDEHVAVSVDNFPASSTSASSQVVLSQNHISDHDPCQNSQQEDEEEKSPLLNENLSRQGAIHIIDENSERNENANGGFSRYFKMVMPDIMRRKEVANSENEYLLPDMVVGHGSHVGDIKIEVKVDGNQGISSPDTSMDPEKSCTEENHGAGHVDNGLIGCSQQYEIGIKATVGECRICQEEDDIANLESPCACSGSLKFAHRKCVQHWCNEKGDTLCEICQKPFEGGYVAPEQAEADSIPINIGAGWDIASGQPRIFALAADHHFLDAEYDEYAGSQAHSAACFRSVALMLIALLLLRHIVSMTGEDDEDASTFFMLSLVRAAGFLIPCYIMARAMNALQIRRQRQEAAMAAATAAAVEVRYLIQASQVQGVISHGNPAA